MALRLDITHPWSKEQNREEKFHKMQSIRECQDLLPENETLLQRARQFEEYCWKLNTIFFMFVIRDLLSK